MNDNQKKQHEIRRLQAIRLQANTLTKKAEKIIAEGKELPDDLVIEIGKIYKLMENGS